MQSFIFCRGVNLNFYKGISRKPYLLLLRNNHHHNKTTETNHKNVKNELYTIPNMITISRIAASPLLGIAIAYDMKLAALSGCAMVAFSDWLDGYYARKYNQTVILFAYILNVF